MVTNTLAYNSSESIVAGSNFMALRAGGYVINFFVRDLRIIILSSSAGKACDRQTL